MSIPKGGTAAVGVTVDAQGVQRADHAERRRPARRPDGPARARSPRGRRVGVAHALGRRRRRVRRRRPRRRRRGAGADGPIVVAAAKTDRLRAAGDPADERDDPGRPARRARARRARSTLDAPADADRGRPRLRRRDPGQGRPRRRAPTARSTVAVAAPAAGPDRRRRQDRREGRRRRPSTVNAAAEVPLGPVDDRPDGQGEARRRRADARRARRHPRTSSAPPRSSWPRPASRSRPGTTVEVKGKVVRKGAFKEPVTVKVNGLPAGLKADPVTVAADQSEFTLKVVADAEGRRGRRQGRGRPGVPGQQEGLPAPRRAAGGQGRRRPK